MCFSKIFLIISQVFLMDDVEFKPETYFYQDACLLSLTVRLVLLWQFLMWFRVMVSDYIIYGLFTFNYDLKQLTFKYGLFRVFFFLICQFEGLTEELVMEKDQYDLYFQTKLQKSLIAHNAIEINASLLYVVSIFVIFYSVQMDQLPAG